MSFNKSLRIFVTLLTGFHWIESTIGAATPKRRRDDEWAAAHRICQHDSMRYNHTNFMQANTPFHYQDLMERTAREQGGKYPDGEDEVSWFGKIAFGSRNFNCGAQELGCQDMPDCEKVAMHVLATEPSWPQGRIAEVVRWRWFATLSIQEVAQTFYRLDVGFRIYRVQDFY